MSHFLTHTKWELEVDSKYLESEASSYMLQGYLPTITPNSRALGGVRGSSKDPNKRALRKWALTNGMRFKGRSLGESDQWDDRGGWGWGTFWEEQYSEKSLDIILSIAFDTATKRLFYGEQSLIRSKLILRKEVIFWAFIAKFCWVCEKKVHFACDLIKRLAAAVAS